MRASGAAPPAGAGEAARNVEIKARIQDLAGCRARVLGLAPAPAAVLAQRDTFFAVARGRLKLRQAGAGPGELIFYERPDRPGPKESRYSRCPCPEPAALSAVLGQAVGVRGVVDKRREVFVVGRSRIHLDEVAGLGAFLEIEVVLEAGESAAQGEREARDLLAALGVPESALVARAYIDLLEAEP